MPGRVERRRWRRAGEVRGVSLHYGEPQVALGIVFAVLAFNVLGDGLRDVLDPRTTR